MSTGACVGVTGEVMGTEYSEFVGLTQEIASLIESHREKESETKSDILWRILPRKSASTSLTSSNSRLPISSATEAVLDLGQGVKLPIDDRIYLFLSKEAMENTKPDGYADVKVDGLYVDGNIKIDKSRGSYIHPAMQFIQKRKNHYNAKGEIVSLSAWRQWHVRKNNQFVSLLDCKDPKLARTRRHHKSGAELLAELEAFSIPKG